MSSRTIEALATACVGLALVIVVRWGLGVAFARYERRLAQRDPADAARRRTTLGFLRRVIVAIVAAIAVWNVLSLYPETDQIVNALLASSAVSRSSSGSPSTRPSRTSARGCWSRSRSRSGSATG